MPPCPRCFGPTHITWEHGQAPSDGTFKPLNIDGKIIEDPAAFARVLTRAASMNPGCSFEIDHESEAAGRRRIDELRHRSYMQKQKRGVTPEIEREHASARARAEQEGRRRAEEKGLDPTPAGKQAAEALGSPSRAAGWIPP